MYQITIFVGLCVLFTWLLCLLRAIRNAYWRHKAYKSRLALERWEEGERELMASLND